MREKSAIVKPGSVLILDKAFAMLLCHRLASKIVNFGKLPGGLEFFNAITQAMCTSFKLEILQGIHISSDTYKIALFTSAATLDATTAAYSSTNEASGTGYSAGGMVLSGFASTSSGTTAWIDWTSDPTWMNATITARGALIYNSSRSNKAVAVLDFSTDQTSTNGNFVVTLPVADASNALIRIA